MLLALYVVGTHIFCYSWTVGNRQAHKEEQMETCLICFEDYRIENTKDHQCPDVWSCGACGEYCDISEGTVAINQGLIEFTHSAEICGAQDEIEA
jgi:hypothetical protein